MYGGTRVNTLGMILYLEGYAAYDCFAGALQDSCRTRFKVITIISITIIISSIILTIILMITMTIIDITITINSISTPGS